MTDRRPSSTKLRRQVFDRQKYQCQLTGRILMTCHICGFPIDPVREKWDADHVTRRVLSNDDSLANVLPAHENCHKEKTACDVRAHTKGKRQSNKHFNIERKHRRSWRPPGTKHNWATGRLERIEAEDEA